MTILTAPNVGEDLAASVILTVEDESMILTPEQAEDLALSLNRSATAARYEAAISKDRIDLGGSIADASDAVDSVREFIERVRISRS